MKQAEWAHRANGASFNRFHVQESASNGVQAKRRFILISSWENVTNRAAAILDWSENKKTGVSHLLCGSLSPGKELCVQT